jgi:hypothetical protein
VFGPVASFEALTVRVATPLETDAEPSEVPPARNVTVPVGVPPFAAVTVAVRVVLPFAARLVWLDVSVSVVEVFDIVDTVIVAVPIEPV